jgi:putative SOS response-associated peptidase YedK
MRAAGDRVGSSRRLAGPRAFGFVRAMCGRFTFTDPDAALRHLFGYDGPALDIAPRYNVAPTQLCTVVRPAPGCKRAIAALRWGLVPAWAKDRRIGASLINARAETLGEKPAFRAAFAKRRCLVPADGFYEWQGEGKDKRPFRIALAGNRPFALAGIWERWRDPAAADAVPVESFAIVTCEAAPAIAAIHHRMPVIVPPEHFAAWLDAEGRPAAAVAPLLVPYAGGDLVAQAVGARVNNARNDDPDCLAPAA